MRAPDKTLLCAALASWTREPNNTHSPNSARHQACAQRRTGARPMTGCRTGVITYFSKEETRTQRWTGAGGVIRYFSQEETRAQRWTGAGGVTNYFSREETRTRRWKSTGGIITYFSQEGTKWLISLIVDEQYFDGAHRSGAKKSISIAVFTSERGSLPDQKGGEGPFHFLRGNAKPQGRD